MSNQFSEDNHVQPLEGFPESDLITSIREHIQKFPTLDQAEEAQAKRLGIKKEYLAPDGSAETMFFSLAEEWKNSLDILLKVKQV